MTAETPCGRFAEWRPPEGEPVFGTGRFIALRDDASPIPLVQRLSQTVNLVDQDGHANWWVGFQDATYAEIRAAADAGALPGDPTQIYVNVRPTPAGGMFLIEWEFIVELWKVALGVAGTLAVANELHDLYGKVRDRLAGSAIVEGKTEEWLRRNGHADFLEHMLRGEPWSAFKLASLLGCTVDEAGKILALYGYEEREPNSWVYVAGNEWLGLPATDLSARVVRAYMNEARFRYASSAVPEGELALLFEEIIRQAAEQGNVPDLPHEEYYRKEQLPSDDADG